MTPSASTQQLFNDGQIQYGSLGPQTFKYSASPQSTAVASYGSTRGVFLIEDFNARRPSKLKEVPDEIGGPRGQYAVKQNATATAVIQFNDSASANPQNGDVFSASLETEIGTEYWIIHALDRAYKMEDYWKVTATFTKVINPTAIPNFTPL